MMLVFGKSIQLIGTHVTEEILRATPQKILIVLSISMAGVEIHGHFGLLVECAMHVTPHKKDLIHDILKQCYNRYLDIYEITYNDTIDS